MSETLRDLVEMSIVVDPLFSQNCYVLRRRDTSSVLVIDPGLQQQQVLDLLDKDALSCGRILLTHGHPDHVSGVPAVKAAHHCDAALHPDDREQLPGVHRFRDVTGELPDIAIDEDLADGQVISWQGLDIEVLHTPGHTRGSVCFRIGLDLYDGDTLFKQSVGRTDLLGGSWDALVFSIENRLYTLPPETIVYPGHGERTTIRDEMEHNPFVAHRRFR